MGQAMVKPQYSDPVTHVCLPPFRALNLTCVGYSLNDRIVIEIKKLNESKIQTYLHTLYLFIRRNQCDVHIVIMFKKQVTKLFIKRIVYFVLFNISCLMILTFLKACSFWISHSLYLSTGKKYIMYQYKIVNASKYAHT